MITVQCTRWLTTMCHFHTTKYRLTQASANDVVQPKQGHLRPIISAINNVASPYNWDAPSLSFLQTIIVKPDRQLARLPGAPPGCFQATCRTPYIQSTYGPANLMNKLSKSNIKRTRIAEKMQLQRSPGSQ